MSVVVTGVHGVSFSLELQKLLTGLLPYRWLMVLSSFCSFHFSVSCLLSSDLVPACLFIGMLLPLVLGKYDGTSCGLIPLPGLHQET